MEDDVAIVIYGRNDTQRIGQVSNGVQHINEGWMIIEGCRSFLQLSLADLLTIF
jgi:hypothetical protein